MPVFARVIERICDWYVERFGTPTVFALSVVGLLFWLSLIPAMGFWHWNNTAGLLVNSLESTGEWFFAVGTLVIARRIDGKSQVQQQATQEAIARIEALEQRIATQVADELALLRQALGTNKEETT